MALTVSGKPTTSPLAPIEREVGNALPSGPSPSRRADGVATPAANPMRDGPILPTLLGMTLPNLVALGSAALITIAETIYVGRLGVSALGGVALVFPVIMLMQMLSAGAMGGAISGAVSRALGANDELRAEGLARAAAIIGGIAGLGFATLLWLGGPALYRLLGGSGAALQAAIDFSNIAALAILAVWLTNCLASILRGTGDMRTPAAIQLGAGAIQIAVGGTLGLGLFGLPRLGVSGVAVGQLVAFWLSAGVLLVRLGRPGSPIKLRWSGGWPEFFHFSAILRVGLVAALSPLQSVATVLILTAMIASFGPEALAGYGIGARLEFLLIPVAFSVGIACLPMVGIAIGAGNRGRAKAVAWTAGALAAAALAIVGLIFGLAPGLWVDLFAEHPEVVSATSTYLQVAAIGYPFFGLGLSLYFASQGAGKVGGPIVAQSLRLVLVVVGGYVMVATDAPMWCFFALSTAAMIAMGLGTALSVWLSNWGKK